MDTNYNLLEIGKSYKFVIKGFGEFWDLKNKSHNSVILNLGNNDEVSVKAYDWHSENIWNYNDILCEVKGFLNNGLPKLMIVDNRHPSYELYNTYKFQIVRFENRTNSKDNSTFKIIILKDENNFYHEVRAIQNQENRLKAGDKIDCEVLSIKNKLRLRQKNIDDPFYYSFDEIIKSDILKSKYFIPYFGNLFENDKNNFVSQYKSRSGFWVFSYCKQVLQKILINYILDKNWNDAIEVNLLIIIFERWILSSGIIDCFPNEFEKERAKKKAEEVLKLRETIGNVLPYLFPEKHYEFYEKQQIHAKIGELFFFFRYVNIQQIDGVKYAEIIEKLKTEKFSTTDIDYLRKLSFQIETKKTSFLKNINDDYFVLAKTNILENNCDLNNYFIWSYCQYILFSFLGEIIKRNLVSAQLLRFQSSSKSSYQERATLLYNAFYLLSNSNLDYSIPISRENDKITIDIEKLTGNPNDQNEYYSQWETIIDGSKKNKHFEVNIFERFYKGYKIRYKDINGHLPFQNISDRNLKFYAFDDVNWATTIEIPLYSKDFNFYLGKQLSPEEKDYKSENIFNKKGPEDGNIIDGKIKAVVDYGIFVSTIYGDGLLYLNNISDENWDKSKLDRYFKVGDSIFVKVLDYNLNKLNLGFKQLIGTDYEVFFYEYFDGKENNDLINNEEDVFNFEQEGTFSFKDHFEYQLEREKGFVFEQFALLKNDIAAKVNYFKLAKHFFSNIKNARSYLLNIYLEYFDSLSHLDDVIKYYSFDKYDGFKTRMSEIKTRIEPQTLENFPESENLIFFIEILTLFNDKSLDGLDCLVAYVKKYSQDTSKHLLKILAKITLSNNILISETDENDKSAYEFSLKNLKKIREYIENGIYSLGESIEDKIAREIQEKIFYWREKIKLEEGEKLEFKSTFKTPIPDDKKRKIVLSLGKELAKNDNENGKAAILERIDEIKGQKAQKAIIHSALKAIAAFANTNGGTLLLGVSDNKEIYGLEEDYKSFENEKDKNRDGFGKFFGDTLKDYFGNSFSSIILEKEFLKFPEGDVLIINVKPSPEEIFLLKDENAKSTQSLYVRNLTSVEKLEGIELAKFIKQKFRKQFLESSFNH